VTTPSFGAERQNQEAAPLGCVPQGQDHGHATVPLYCHPGFQGGPGMERARSSFSNSSPSGALLECFLFGFVETLSSLSSLTPQHRIPLCQISGE
jgi:hypothetical protein